MPAVDLFGADAGRIRNAYKTHLGRDAGDDEVSGWLGGSYGGGGVDQWENQIAGSDEARQRKPPAGPTPTTPPVLGQGQNNGTLNPPTTTTPPGYQGTDWWGQQGVPSSQMFDFTTGQMKPGWQRSGTGYERTGTGTGWDADPKGNFQNWFLSNIGNLAPSGKNLETLAPYLQKYGIRLGARNAQGMIDTVITPDGQAWDVIEAATLDGGKRWQWNPAGGAGQVGGGTLPPNQYSDPYTQMLEQLIKSRIGNLQGGYDDFYRQQYEQGLQKRQQALGQAEPKYTQLMDYLQSRFTDLKGPGYTGAENEVIRTGALDPIERDRSAAKQRVMESLSARGLTPDSGVAQAALLQVDQAFDGMRGVTQNTLTTNDLARREDRNQRAEGIGAQLVDIPQAREREQLDVMQALEILSGTAREEDAARSREAISYAGGLNDISAQRFQQALQAAGLGGNPSSLLSGLQGIAGLNQNASAINRSSQSNLWSGLGSIAAILSRR